MDGPETVQQYRLLDVLYGQLDTMVGVRDALLRLRREQIAVRAGALQSRLAIILCFVVTAIPTLWGVLPEEFHWKWLFIFLLVLITAAFLLQLGKQFKENGREKAALDKILRTEIDRPLEQQPDYILTQISSFGTRLTLALAALRDESLDGNTRRKSQGAAEYWESRLTGLESDVEQLHREKKLEQDEYDMIRNWIASAKSQPGRDGCDAND